MAVAGAARRRPQPTDNLPSATSRPPGRKQAQDTAHHSAPGSPHSCPGDQSGAEAEGVKPWDLDRISSPILVGQLAIGLPAQASPPDPARPLIAHTPDSTPLSIDSSRFLVEHYHAPMLSRSAGPRSHRLSASAPTDRASEIERRKDRICPTTHYVATMTAAEALAIAKKALTFGLDVAPEAVAGVVAVLFVLRGFWNGRTSPGDIFLLFAQAAGIASGLEFLISHDASGAGTRIMLGGSVLALAMEAVRSMAALTASDPVKIDGPPETQQSND